MSNEATVRRSMILHGLVQGVSMRDHVQHAARQAGVTGWAHNRDDGTVEVQAEGALDAVQRVIEAASAGPAGAEVTHVAITELPTQGGDAFSTG